MTMTHRTFYLIFVRPPGSHIWTQHIKMPHKGTAIPFTATTVLQANQEAMRVVETTRYCARVVTVNHPSEIDTLQYAQFADGDSRYYVAGEKHERKECEL